MYTLYYAPDYASLVVRMVLEELALPFETVWVNRAQEAQKSPAYLALNPQGQIPVLVCPEQNEPLFETAACLLYLAQRHADAGTPLWPGSKGVSDRSHGRALKWLFFLSNTLHAELKLVFYASRYLAQPIAEHEENLLQGMQRRVYQHLCLIEAQLARNLARAMQASAAPRHTFLLGDDGYSVCDIYLAVCVRWALLYPVTKAMGADVFRTLPHLHTLLAHLEARPALQKAMRDEKLIPYRNGTTPFFTAPSLPSNVAEAIGSGEPLVQPV